MSTPPEEPLHDEVAAWLRRRAAGHAEPLDTFLTTTRFGREAVGRVLAELDGTGADPAEAETFGRYRIGSLLGRGGMGTVHLAHDTHLGREVALKRIRPELLLSAEARARFAAETKAIARLEHPHICNVLDAGEQAGQPFLVLQYVRGQSLANRIQVAIAGDANALAELTTERCLRLAEQVARALHHAHQKGLLHRDVKPSNILLGEDGEPYLIDFGLARAATDAETLTTPGATPGTYRYMSPEQLAGQRDLDARTDVFSLALCLAQALTLRHPFAAGTEVECVHAIQHAPAQFDGPRGRRLSNDLRRVLEAALAKDPAQRYADARAFADDLARVRQHEPIVAVQPSPTRRAWLWSRRHPWVLAHGLALLLLASAALLLARSAARAARAAQRFAQATEALRVATTADATPFLALERAVAAAEVSAPHALDTLLWQRLDACGEVYRLPRHTPDRISILGVPSIEPGGVRLAAVLSTGALRVWRAADGELLQTIPAHDVGTPVSHAAAAFHPKEPRLFTTGFDGLVKTWSTADWQVQGRTPIGPPGVAGNGGHSLAVSPDGRWLAAGDTHGYLLLLDLHSGSERRLRVSSDSSIGGLDWCPQSRLVVVRLRPAGSSFDESTDLVVLSAETAVELWRQGYARDAVTSLGWHDSRRWLAVGTTRGRVEVRVDEDGSLVASTQHFGHDPVVRWCGFAPGDDRLIAATPDGFATFAVVAGALKMEHTYLHERHRGLVAMAFLDRATAAAMFRDGSVAYLDPRDWRTYQGFAAPHFATGLTALGWADGGVIASRNLEIIAWSAPGRAWCPQWYLHTGAVTVVETLPGSRLLTAGVDGKVHVVEPQAGARELADFGAGVKWVRVAAAGRRVCFGDAACRIHVFDGESLRPLGSTSGTVAEFLDEDTLALADGATVLRWDLASGARTKLYEHAGDVHALAVQAEANLVWSGGADQNVWQASSADPRLGVAIPAMRRGDFVRGSPVGRIMALHFVARRDLLLVSSVNDSLAIVSFGRKGQSPGGNHSSLPRFGGRICTDPQERYAVVSDFGFGCVSWVDLEAVELRLLAQSDVHTQTVTAIRFTPDGRLCLTASLDGTVQIWDAATRTIRSTLRLEGTTVHDACFTPDGAWIATGDGRGHLRLWPTDPLPVARDYVRGAARR